MNKFTIAWIVWALWFVFWETWALIERTPFSTLSDHIQWLVRKGGSLTAFLVAAVCAWLGYHFIFEEGVWS
ncbi:MAG UNVERIFIED_CONTAM: hypothetical protein LOD86_04870 [Thermobifida fusca]